MGPATAAGRAAASGYGGYAQPQGYPQQGAAPQAPSAAGYGQPAGYGHQPAANGQAYGQPAYGGAPQPGYGQPAYGSATPSGYAQQPDYYGQSAAPATPAAPAFGNTPTTGAGRPRPTRRSLNRSRRQHPFRQRPRHRGCQRSPLSRRVTRRRATTSAPLQARKVMLKDMVRSRYRQRRSSRRTRSPHTRRRNRRAGRSRRRPHSSPLRMSAASILARIIRARAAATVATPNPRWPPRISTAAISRPSGRRTVTPANRHFMATNMPRLARNTPNTVSMRRKPNMASRASTPKIPTQLISASVTPRAANSIKATSTRKLRTTSRTRLRASAAR